MLCAHTILGLLQVEKTTESTPFLRGPFSRLKLIVFFWLDDLSPKRVNY
jgi:hypothetical protein